VDRLQRDAQTRVAMPRPTWRR